MAELVALSTQTGFSRVPVIGADIDGRGGVALVKNVYQVPAERWAATPVTKIMRPPLIVPETRNLRSLLLDMRSQRSPLAVVMDEHGGTAGIVTQRTWWRRSWARSPTSTTDTEPRRWPATPGN